jgi:hypothetical protein
MRRSLQSWSILLVIGMSVFLCHASRMQAQNTSNSGLTYTNYGGGTTPPTGAPQQIVVQGNNGPFYTINGTLPGAQTTVYLVDTPNGAVNNGVTAPPATWTGTLATANTPGTGALGTEQAVLNADAAAMGNPPPVIVNVDAGDPDIANSLQNASPQNPVYQVEAVGSTSAIPGITAMQAASAESWVYANSPNHSSTAC